MEENKMKLWKCSCRSYTEKGYVSMTGICPECGEQGKRHEYYKQSIAPTIVGHKFVVKSLNPLPKELVYTSWKDVRK